MKIQPGDRFIWVSCAKFTVGVVTGDDGRIRDSAPMVRKFIGQPLGNLLRWAKGFGRLRWEDITE
jgi:hypothetical protein